MGEHSRTLEPIVIDLSEVRAVPKRAADTSAFEQLRRGVAKARQERVFESRRYVGGEVSQAGSQLRVAPYVGPAVVHGETPPDYPEPA